LLPLAIFQASVSWLFSLPLGWSLAFVALLTLGINPLLGWPCFLLGAALGMSIVPLRTLLHKRVPSWMLGGTMAFANLVSAIAVLLIGGLSAGLSVGQQETISTTIQAPYWLLAVGAMVGMVLAWRHFLRHALEQLVEMMMWPMYRINATGPGLESFPSEGPVVVVANHTAMLDPFWIGKVIPRQVTPMMTSLYFDRPIIRWLMGRVVQAIRVSQATFRREVPELHQAVKALDQGRVLLIFPEGMIKRREKQLLRPFGRGVWHILSDRPDTPIVICRVEGGWGTYTSYFRGPPFVNKRMDWKKPIDIAVGSPFFLAKEVLVDQRATRAFLMQACLDGRNTLGLESPSVQEVLHGVSEDDAGQV